jgi:hypothetical protein
MRDLEAPYRLTIQQAELVRYIVKEGKQPEEAATLAGCHPKSVYRRLRLPGGRPQLAGRSSMICKRPWRRLHIVLRRRYWPTKGLARASGRICPSRSWIERSRYSFDPCSAAAKGHVRNVS